MCRASKGAFPLTLLVFSLFVGAVPARVQAGDLVVKAARKDGHGVIALAKAGCLVVTPLHVVEVQEGTRSPESAITVIGAGREVGSAKLETSFEDIAVYSMRSPKSFCRTPKFPFAGDVDAMLDAHETGAIRYVTETGGQERVRVAISSWSEEFIEVTPISRNNSVSEGASGSALVVAGNFFIGLVLDVEGERIRVIRKDYLLKLLGSLLSSDPSEEDTEDHELIEVRVRRLHREKLCSKTLTLELLETSHDSNPPHLEFIMRDYSSNRASLTPRIHCVQGELCRVVLDSGSYQVEFSQVTQIGADFSISIEQAP